MEKETFHLPGANVGHEGIEELVERGRRLHDWAVLEILVQMVSTIVPAPGRKQPMKKEAITA
jgi:hypothetical protein